MPRADATWVRGDPDFYKSFDFFYCRRSDTESDAEAASKLLETGPREYDRLPLRRTPLVVAGRGQKTRWTPYTGITPVWGGRHRIRT